MAKYIFDTSILVHYVRGSALALHIENSYSPSILPNYSLVSVVSLGEMYSLISPEMGTEKAGGNEKAS